jgi:hypothetical protein
MGRFMPLASREGGVWRGCGSRSRASRLAVASLAERVREPLETLVETVSGGGAGRLDVLEDDQRGIFDLGKNKPYPSALSERVKTKLVSDLSSVHGILAISLVSVSNSAVRVMLTGRSCLLAKTRRRASRSSSSFSMR